jgi:hypothetical protein
MSWRPAYALLAVLVGIAGACSDPPTKPAPAVQGNTTVGGGGGGGGGEGGADSGLDASSDAEARVCTDVPLTGQTVDRVGVVGEPPVATGGTVVDGVYDLTDYTVYVGAGGVGGPTGITAKATIRISGDKLDEVIELGGTGKTATTKRSSSAYSASGATIAETLLCPTTGGGKQVQFTANEPLLILLDPTLKEAFTFTKR